ncbi:MAG TPA: TrmH family RNA methyltransferase [Candidatus Sulfotelmatobacter sp.]|nr:TrmH family RNA methyltransferase [Candidatus Sulfotelmatobacter sp.]
MKLIAKELRNIKPTKRDLGKVKRRDIYFILDSVLDTYNVGGIFRLADAIGVKKVYLCGETETPPNPRIKKASINTTEWVSWEYLESAKDAIQKIKKETQNIQIIAVEQDEKSVFYTEIEYKLPIAFVVGNETTGISKDVLGLCDYIAEIPMWGVNKSLNVIISLAIVAFEVAVTNKK